MFQIQIKPEIDRFPLTHVTEEEETALALALIAWLDTALVSTGKATAYNTESDVNVSMWHQHHRLCDFDRGILAISLLLPGVTDFAIQSGIVVLLMTPSRPATGILPDHEKAIIHHLLNGLSVPRRLKVFALLRAGKVNNARTRKLILRHILNERRLDLWAVRYRQKLRRVLEHAFGKKLTGILFGITRKKGFPQKPKEAKILRKEVLRFVENEERHDFVLECLRFILGSELHHKTPLLAAFREAKKNLDKGASLPFEVLEGIRSVYHKTKPSGSVLKKTAKTLTKGQQIRMQAKAERDDVKVEFDPKKYGAEQLYVYAFERGFSDEVHLALDLKAADTAAKLPFQMNRIGIVMDNSGSMAGHRTQAMRPAAISHAVQDILLELAREAEIRLLQPARESQTDAPVLIGDTSFARPILELWEAGVDAIFVLTDGYENAPGGRTAELLRWANRMKFPIPVFQVTPVSAAEADGIRKLSLGTLVLPVSQPESLGTGLLKILFQTSVPEGLGAMLALVRNTHSLQFELQPRFRIGNLRAHVNPDRFEFY